MNVAATKARIKNIADKSGKNFQDLLIAYGLERTIYRLSKSKYMDSFLSPLVYAIRENKLFDLKWNYDKKRWE